MCVCVCVCVCVYVCMYTHAHFPDVSAVKNPGWCSAGDAGDMGSIPGSGRSLGGGHSNSL